MQLYYNIASFPDDPSHSWKTQDTESRATHTWSFIHCHSKSARNGIYSPKESSPSQRVNHGSDTRKQSTWKPGCKQNRFKTQFSSVIVPGKSEIMNQKHVPAANINWMFICVQVQTHGKANGLRLIADTSKQWDCWFCILNLLFCWVQQQL